MKNKEVIYVDVDDEITGIIDKVNQAKAKLVALVLPKRATVFQSVVNMKLLKRSAENAKKNLVLVTSDSDILPLAGAVKLHVAKTLQANPEIPDAPELSTKAINVNEPEPSEDEVVDSSKPIGELAGLGTAEELAKNEEEPIELDNLPAADAVSGKKSKTKSYKLAGNKKIKIPNFDKFRLWLILGALGLVLLIILFIFMFKVWPKATITIKTKTNSYNAALTLNLDTGATSLNASNDTVVAKVQQIQKTATSPSVNTTGHKNIGNPATTAVNMTATNCTDLSQPADVTSGSVLQSSGLSYITQQNTSFGSPKLSGGCVVWKSTAQTTINAANPGPSYNGASSFTVSGRQDVTASAPQATSGGSDNIVAIVTATDLTNAQNQISQPSSNGIQNQLAQALSQAGFTAISGTFSGGSPTFKPSTEAGAQATTVTETEVITYTMFGAKSSDLQALVGNAITSQIDPSKQSILNYGLSTATFNVVSSNATTAQVQMNDTATVGTNLNPTTIKKQIVGKKKGDIISLINSYPGISSVNVHYSPFWVSSTPSNPKKVNVILEKANGSSL